jgi:hypothetical protein
MSKLTWIGDSDPEAQMVLIEGVTFVKGEPVEVTDKGLYDALKDNPMFSTDAKAEPVEAIEPDTAELQRRAEEGTEKGVLKDKLRALGVSVQGNASLDTLRAKLAEATK